MKNKCYELVDILDYLLNPEEYKEVGEHIKNCKECEKKEKDIKTLTKIIKGYKCLEVPEGLEEKIKKRIEEERKKKEKRVYTYKRYYIMAGSIAAIFIIMIGFFLLNKYKIEKEAILREVKISLIEERIKIFIPEAEIEEALKEIKEEVKEEKGKVKEIIKKEGGIVIKVKMPKGEVEKFKEEIRKKFKGGYGIVINIELEEE